MKKHLIRLIPNSIKPMVRKLYYFPMDVIERLRGVNSMIPPRSMIFVGNGNFKKTGRIWKKYFIELGNLQPTDRVLDVGCGIGRMAIPLTNYLSKDGEYWGFDIVKQGIDWCQSRISSKFSNFHFQHSDVYNQHYNPNGKVAAESFQFPFENEFFDLVFLTSVFTHMVQPDVENYLSEISRVLKTKGKCLITFFILNEDSIKQIRLGHSTLDFRYTVNNCLTINEEEPELAIAYEEEIVVRLFNKYGLKITQPIHYGNWCKRDRFLTYQDLIVATKIDRVASKLDPQDIALNQAN
jgi:ubiquinone/menaquinone biosynthesis C-methylase UbiE